MIPAILSCIFVAYLYQSLNNESPKSKGASKSNHEESVTAQNLVDRIDALQKRLNALAADDRKGGSN